MSENEEINGAILAIMESMRMQGSSLSTLKGYKNVYNVFKRYLSAHSISKIDENVCLEYVYVKTGHRFESFECVISSSSINYHVRPLRRLLRYLQDGQFHFDVRKTKPAFVCPACFKSEYEAFCGELTYRGYKEATIESITRRVRFLIIYLAAQEVSSSADITIRHIEDYLQTLDKKATSYVGLFLDTFRSFFSLLYERRYIVDDLASKLPKVRIPHNASIPYVWSKDDIKRLLCAIDRADPKGKRDYAIFLIAIRLGLRIGDIRNLKKSSIDWNRKTINLIMAKTGQPIELPLLKDIGWAIIDYLQNGRPVTNSERLFVRHRAPFNAFGNNNNFHKELHRYILKAGLDIPSGLRHGMHSLRSTLAGNMLEIKSSLPVISGVLGHQSVNTTSRYLSIDIERLRKCALDPEEVFANENRL
jgi:site-specific recombinase XerD